MYNPAILEQIQTGKYELKERDPASLKLFAWLQHNSLSSLSQTNNTKINITSQT